MSATTIEAVQHAHPDGSGLLAMTDRNEFVREVLNRIHVRPLSSFHLWHVIHFLWLDWID